MLNKAVQHFGGCRSIAARILNLLERVIAVFGDVQGWKVWKLLSIRVFPEIQDTKHCNV